MKDTVVTRNAPEGDAREANIALGSEVCELDSRTLSLVVMPAPTQRDTGRGAARTR